MSRRVRVKPSRGQSAFGFFVGIIFCCIGLFVVIPTFGPFGLIWTLFAVIITIMNGISAFSDKGIASHEIVIDDMNDYSNNNFEYKKSSEERMKELQQLYQQGMISEEEYNKKRAQILEQL